jgi:hypothetical protein
MEQWGAQVLLTGETDPLEAFERMPMGAKVALRF